MTLKSLILFFTSLLILTQADPQIFTYKTVGNLSIEAIVTSPPDLAPNQLSPVFFTMHLGGFISEGKDRALTAQEQEEALSRNWTIVSIDYRLIPFVLLEDIVQDVQDAYDWVRTNLSQVLPINPEMITVFGQSAGGGLALISGYKFVPRPKAVIAFYPYLANFNDPFISDHITPPSEELLAGMEQINQSISNYVQTSRRGNDRWKVFLQMCSEKKEGWALVSRDPKESAEKVKEKLREFSAVDNMDKDYPPTYLSHGLQDSVVLFTQSVQMAKRLEENNVEFVLDLVYGAKHAFDFRDHSQETWEEHILPTFNFAEKFMK